MLIPMYACKGVFRPVLFCITYFIIPREGAMLIFAISQHQLFHCLRRTLSLKKYCIDLLHNRHGNLVLQGQAFGCLC